MLKDLRNIKGLFLLLLYLFGNSPTIMFHQHDNEVAAYSKASQCEKAVYYGEESNACKHKTHITKAFKKCSLCDNHYLSAHIINHYPLVHTNTHPRFEYEICKVHFYETEPIAPQDRVPPIV